MLYSKCMNVVVYTYRHVLKLLSVPIFIQTVTHSLMRIVSVIKHR